MEHDEYKDIVRSYANFDFVAGEVIDVGKSSGWDTYQYSMEVNIRGMCIEHSFNASRYLDKWQDILIGDFISSPDFERFKELETIERRLNGIKKLGI